MTSVHYSKHAQERLVVRRVTKSQVTAAIRNPDALYQDVPSSAMVAVKRMKNRYLVVVYVALEGERRRVITVYHASDVDRLIRRKLGRRIWRIKA